MDARPIGVFDSGLGGLSTVKAMKEIMPHEDIIYFGDTGRVPYGTRSNETIESYAAQDIRFLRSFACKMIVVACGTVSTVGENLIARIEEPATGITHPAAQAAVRASRNGRIGLMGTSATIYSGAFERAIRQLSPTATLTAVACPLLVPLVENNWIAQDDEVANAAVQRYVQPLLEAACDTVILGCTHFPHLAPVIQKHIGAQVTLIDSGREEAAYAKQLLQQYDIENEATHAAVRKYYVSDKTQNFSVAASTLLGENIDDKCEFVDIFQFI